jgi:uncharacterized protein (TIGR02231 family)
MSRISMGAGLMLGASFVVLAGSAAVAGELTARSQIDGVTVFPRGATVVRVAQVALPAGDTTVLIDDLPTELDANSLKVEGKGDNAFAIASVETRDVPADAEADPARVALNADIQAIEDRIAAIDDRIDALDGRRKFLETLIEQAPAGFAKGLAEGKGSIADWANAAQSIGDGLAQVADASRAAEIERRDLEKQREAKQTALADLPPVRDHKAVRIALAADAATNGTLTLSYRTVSARWVPTYDAQLTTGDGGAEPSLALVRRAEVTQETGEDWSGVHLTLSTAPAEGGTAAPTLDPLLVSLYDPDSYTQRDMAMPAPTAPSTAFLRSQKMEAGDVAAGAANEAAPAKVIEAALDFGDFRAEFRVPGVVSIDSGKGARSLQIATERFSPKLGVKAAPAVSETAYLAAAFTAAEGAPLLGGRVALFRDGTFVGNGQIDFTNAGADVDLGFGVDERVHIKRATLDHQTGDAGIPIIASRKTDTRSYKMTVENLHARPMEITVLDRLPYAEDGDITVRRLRDATAPSTENVDDKRGILAWTYTYAPGESHEIVNAYEVSWPANQSLLSME